MLNLNPSSTLSAYINQPREKSLHQGISVEERLEMQGLFHSLHEEVRWCERGGGGGGLILKLPIQ